MTMTVRRDFYRPFEYPWAYDFYHAQAEINHWTPSNVPLDKDVDDWKKNLPQPLVNLYSSLFRFFTQADADVNSGYTDHILRWYKKPELKMMFSQFAAYEAIHIDAYSRLIDQLGLPESDYSAFMNIQVMKDKHEFFKSLDPDPNSAFDRALFLATQGCFGEGLQLFGTFAVLLNAPHAYGCMMGMGQTVDYSIRDENLHVQGNVRTFHQELAENPDLDLYLLKEKIDEHFWICFNTEVEFLNVCYEIGNDEKLPKEDVILFLKHLSNKRYLQLGFDPIFKGLEQNRLEWLERVLGDQVMENYFEVAVTSYSGASLTGTWNEAFEKLREVI